MTVRLTEENIDKLIDQELAKLNAEYKEQGLRETSWLGELDPNVVALEAQRKLFREMDLHFGEIGFWDLIKKELEL